MNASEPMVGSRRAVRLAVILLVVSEFLLGDIRAALSWYAASWVVPFWVSGVGGVCTAFVLWKIYQGRSWARATFGILAGLGFAIWLTATSGNFAYSRVDWFLAAGQFAVRAWAAILLFRSPGSTWFKDHPLRHTSVIASVLLTLALLWFVPLGIDMLRSVHSAGDNGDVYRNVYYEELNRSAITMLAIVLVGLLVTWVAYARRVRWAWPVMFVIVWGWVFPAVAWHDFLRYFLRGGLEQTPGLAQLLLMSTSPFGQERAISQEMLVFGLMIAGLVLPMKAFFWSRESASIQKDGSSLG
jgi:hypothetical protein